MNNPFKSILNWVAKNFRKDASKMLIWTGVASWSLSSLAQISAVLINPKISNEQKSFLVPQELADAAVNIGSFFLITQMAKKSMSKLFSTGKLAPKSVRAYLKKHKDLYAKKVGKLDFDLDEVLKQDKLFPKDQYWACKNFATTVATVGAGILSSNIITPIVRNEMASTMQKNYINTQKQSEIKRPDVKQTIYQTKGLKI